MLFRLRPAGGVQLAKQIRQHHRGGAQHHCPATSAAEGGRGEKRQKNQLITNVGLSRRPWTGWPNRSKTGGGGSGSNMMILMLLMQMQQQTHQFSMHQQMFQQQMQIQMAAMEKRAETSEKYLRRIAKTIGRNKRKRGGYDDEDDSTDDDE